MRYSKRCGSSGTKASADLAATRSVARSWLAIRTRPRVGMVIPARQWRVVVLPAPWAHQAYHLAGLYPEGQVLDRHQFAVHLLQAFGFDH